MKRFAQLYNRIDCNTNINIQIDAFVDYFTSVDDEDKLWTIALFSQKRPQRIIISNLLRDWAIEESQLPDWLFDESYQIVGDLAETISLLVNNIHHHAESTLSEWINTMIKLKDKGDSEKKEFVLWAWRLLTKEEVFIINKLLTGAFRTKISQKILSKALSKVLNISEGYIANQLIGKWTPSNTNFDQLFSRRKGEKDYSKPYPFYQSNVLDQPISALGNEREWQVEYKWGGLRTQLIKRNKELFLWTEDGDLVTASYPEFEILINTKEDHFVIEGQIVVFCEGVVKSMAMMQKRIGRQKVSKKLLTQTPCLLICEDLLEYKEEDVREKPLYERKWALKNLLENISNEIQSPLLMSESIEFDNWEELSQKKDKARDVNAEGLIIKYKNGEYNGDQANRESWVWKVNSFTIHAILIYAHRGSGLGSIHYVDYTFAVRGKKNTLVPITKAHLGLSESEVEEISKFVKKNTIERFGPVRSIKPELVFEISFDAISRSARHKSGIVLQNPIIKQWRRDKKPEDVHTQQDLLTLIVQ